MILIDSLSQFIKSITEYRYKAFAEAGFGFGFIGDKFLDIKIWIPFEGSINLPEHEIMDLIFEFSKGCVNGAGGIIGALLLARILRTIKNIRNRKNQNE